MLKLKNVEVETEEETQSLKNENMPVAETDQIVEPAWLRCLTPTDQPEDTSPASEPAWLHRLELSNTLENASPRLEQSDSFNSEDTLAHDELASSLRSKFREGEPKSSATESSPGFASSAQTNSSWSRVLHSLKTHRLLIVIAVLSVVPLLCAAGWFGIVNSSLLASTLSTATPQKLSALVKPTWPATWTPTAAATATKTSTPTSTATATRTAKPTRVPPTRTPRPPSPTTSPYLFNSVSRGCQHSGGTYIEGTVSSLFGEVTGAHVSLGTSPGGNVIQTLVTGKDKSPGYYTFVIRADGPYPGTFYVWVTDTAGNPLSDPNSGRVVTNAIRSDSDPASCWQAFVDFVATR